MLAISGSGDYWKRGGCMEGKRQVVTKYIGINVSGTKVQECITRIHIIVD